MPLQLERRSRRVWEVARRSAKGFIRIDGRHWAKAFAFDALFALLPLCILAVILASCFVDRESAERAIVAYVEGYVPLDGGMRARILGAIDEVIRSRDQAGLVAILILVWSALRCFITLARVTNRAWGDEAFSWWRMPLKGMALLGITGGAVLLGMAAPALASVGKSWLFPANDFGSLAYAMWGFVVPLLVLFLSLALFYKWAPRRSTRFTEVWIAAAWGTLLLQGIESLFVVYIEHFATLDTLYGLFGALLALLLWIYLSGCGFIFGACLCAARAE